MSMANKKNLPNIPIYIGDWERDCNVLSLESEAAWMRIVFKLWTKGKQNSIKMPTKSLQNLWRCSEQNMNEILQDLIYNEIAIITVDSDFVEFTCRRFVKENNISEIRSEASKGNKNANKTSTKPKQNLNKKTQNTDIDIENDIVIESKENKKQISEIEVFDAVVIPFENPDFKEQWQQWKIYRSKQHKFQYKSVQSEQAALNELSNLSEQSVEKAIEIMHRSMSNGWKGFFKAAANKKENNNNVSAFELLKQRHLS